MNRKNKNKTEPSAPTVPAKDQVLGKQLLTAVENYDPDALDLLENAKSKNIDLDHHNEKQETSLHIAAKRADGSDLQIVAMLLRAGANPLVKNFYQQKTNPRSKMIEAIQEWDNKEKKWRVKIMKKIIKTMKISTVRFISKFEISKYCSDQHSRIFCNFNEF